MFKDESCERIRYAYAQRKNDQSVLGIVPGLQRVIPAVEQLDERADKAGDQNERNKCPSGPRSHAEKYTAQAVGAKRKLGRSPIHGFRCA
jgi:hypothetical protein